MTRFALLLALGFGIAATASHASTLNLNPTADGVVTENGDGTTGLAVSTGTDLVPVTQSVFLSTTVAFEFNLTGINQSNVSSVQFVVSTLGGTVASDDNAAIFLEGTNGDGSITTDDLSSAYGGTTPGTPLGVEELDDGVVYAFNAQIIYDLDVSTLFALAGVDGLVTLRLYISDPDTVAGFNFFSLESAGVDYNLIEDGIQGGNPAYLAFNMAAVPLPAGLPLLLAGLGALGFVARRRR